MTQWYVNPVGGYWLLIGVCAVLVALLAWIGLPAHRASRGRRATLVALRAGTFVLLAIALLRPGLIQTETKKQSSTIVLLADDSRSMKVNDAFDNRSRWQALRRALDEAQAELARLAVDVEVKAYTFATDLAPVEINDGALALPDEPAGEQTALGAALEDVLRNESGKRLAGVIVLSDGMQRALAPRDLAPQTAARRLAELGCPLYAIAFGQSRGVGQTRDAALRDLVVNQTVFIKNELTAAGTARLDGLANLDVPVELLFETADGRMEAVANRSLRTTQNSESLAVALSHIPETAGEFKLALRIPPQPGELVTNNNSLATFVTVLAGGLNVLYLEGELRVEQKFLRRSLDASPDIRVDYVRLAERKAADRKTDLLGRFAPGKYDVYILGDLDAAVFRDDELAALADVVKNGAGLMMLGGGHSFGPGGYSKTPLADLLPVAMSDLERQRFDDAIRKDVHLPGPLAMMPARPLGIRHFVLSLAADNAAAWQALPPLEGANKLGEPKLAAQVLAETPDGRPLLVAHQAGGRVMAFAGDSTWRWWMAGHESAHKRFWRQVVLWLARKDEQTAGNVWINLPQRRYAPLARVEFAVGARSPQGEKLPDAQFQCEVLLPDGKRQALPLARAGEDASGVFGQTEQAGDYSIQVTARQGDEIIGTAKARFLVFERDLELDNAVADAALLASLAKMTESVGGQALPPEELPDLIRRIADAPPKLDVQTAVRKTPWDTWPFELAFIGLLCIEWYLRKRWRLV